MLLLSPGLFAIYLPSIDTETRRNRLVRVENLTPGRCPFPATGCDRLGRPGMGLP